MTKSKTTETLDQRSERVQAEAEEVRLEHERIANEQATKLEARQRDFDQALVDNYRRRDGEAAVEQARRELKQAVAELPVTQALAAYLAAQIAVYDGWHEYLGARGRLGIPTAAAQPPPVGSVMPLGDYVHRAATELAHEVLMRSREESENNRNGMETP